MEADMNGVEKERFALKAYRLAEMTKDDYDKLALHHSQLSKERWLFGSVQYFSHFS